LSLLRSLGDPLGPPFAFILIRRRAVQPRSIDATADAENGSPLGVCRRSARSCIRSIDAEPLPASILGLADSYSRRDFALRGRRPDGALAAPLWRGRLARVAQCPLTAFDSCL
jgi:hypothetical protein